MLLVAKKRPKPKTNREVTKIQRLNTKANKSTTKKAKSKVQTITNTRNQERKARNMSGRWNRETLEPEGTTEQNRSTDRGEDMDLNRQGRIMNRT